MKKFLCLFCLLLLLSACAHKANETLFYQLGGREGLSKIVTSFITNIGKDKQILPYFVDAKISRFRNQIYDHLCDITDGPCHYNGDSMIDIHTGMNINESDFNRLVDLLYKSMDEQHIPHPIQNKLIGRLAPLRSTIIYI